MSQKILLSSSGRFVGPFTDNRTAGSGQTLVELTPEQYSVYSGVTKPDPLKAALSISRYMFFDAGQSPCFYWGSLDQCAETADNIDHMLIFEFAKINNDLARAKLMPLRATINFNAEKYGLNFGVIDGVIRNDIYRIIETALPNETDSQLLAIQAEALARPQWELP